MNIGGFTSLGVVLVKGATILLGQVSMALLYSGMLACFFQGVDAFLDESNSRSCNRI